MRTCFLRVGCVALLLASAGVRADEFDSGGVKIHYTVQGKGGPVILIHGLGSSAIMNWDLPGITASLTQNHQVIEFDNRGHGQSDKPEIEGQYGTNMVEDVVRLMDHLHIQKADIVGYSMGGMITMKLLATHPDRVKSAVLGGMGWLKADSPLAEFWETLGGRENQKVPAACLHGISQLGVTEAAVKAVKIPVTIIVGDRDPCRRLYVEPLDRIRSDWPVKVVPGAGHLNCIAKPEFKTFLDNALQVRAVK